MNGVPLQGQVPDSITEAASPATQAWLKRHPAEAILLGRFVMLMADELAANDGKGNRPGWMTMDRKTAVAEVHWHAAKLAVAAKVAGSNPGRGASVLMQGRHAEAVSETREFAADVGNCALMLLDVLGLLGMQPPPVEPTELAPHIHHGRESL